MSIFFDQLYGLLIFLIAVLLFIGVYKEVSRRLTQASDAVPDTVERGERIMRRRSTQPSPAPVQIQPRESLEKTSMGESLRAAIPETAELAGNIIHALSRRDVIMRIAVDMLVMVLVSILLAIFSGSSIGGLDIYMSTFLPMLGVILVLFTFTEAINGSRVFAVIVGVLILTGISLQGLLKLSDEVPSASELVMFSVASMFLAIAGCFILRLFAETIPRRISVRLLNIVVIGLYLVLMIFGTTVSNTKAWLIVGGFSFQLTELTKLASLLTFGLVFTDRNITADRRLLSALFTLTVNGVFLLLVNELGTLCILGLAFFLMGFMYLPHVRKLVGFALLLIVFATLVLAMCFMCHQAVNPEAQTGSSSDAIQTESAVPGESGEEVDAAQPDGSAQQEKQSIVDKLLSLGDKIWRKFKLRIDLLLYPETVDPLAGGYQSNKAQNALRLSSWLGSVFEVDIPVVQSDYIFTFLVLKMGVVYAIVILIIMLLMLLTGVQGCLTNPSAGVSAAGVAFTLGMVIQSLIAAASATGAFILIGLPFSFLSDGGTAAVTNYMMVVFVIYATGRTVKPVRKQKEEAATIKRKERVS